MVCPRGPRRYLTAQPDAITAGPDGNIWFNDQLSGHKAEGRVTPRGVITEFSKGLEPGGVQDAIIVRARREPVDRAIDPGGIARITPDGVITQYTAGLEPGCGR